MYLYDFVFLKSHMHPHASLIPTPRMNLSRPGIPLDLCPSVSSELWLVTEKGTDELHSQDVNHCN